MKNYLGGLVIVILSFVVIVVGIDLAWIIAGFAGFDYHGLTKSKYYIHGLFLMLIQITAFIILPIVIGAKPIKAVFGVITDLYKIATGKYRV